MAAVLLSFTCDGISCRAQWGCLHFHAVQATTHAFDPLPCMICTLCHPDHREPVLWSGHKYECYLRW
eukprot:2989810-Amphidinium_carterae.1